MESQSERLLDNVGRRDHRHDASTEVKTSPLTLRLAASALANGRASRAVLGDGASPGAQSNGRLHSELTLRTLHDSRIVVDDRVLGAWAEEAGLDRHPVPEGGRRFRRAFAPDCPIHTLPMINVPEEAGRTA